MSNSSYRSNHSRASAASGMEDLSFKFNARDFITTRRCEALESCYELGKLLGQGAHGCVFACTHIESGAKRAVKVLEKCAENEESNKAILDEYLLLKDLDHPNLIRCYELLEGTCQRYRSRFLVLGLSASIRR